MEGQQNGLFYTVSSGGVLGLGLVMLEMQSFCFRPQLKDLYLHVGDHWAVANGTQELSSCT